MLPMPSCHTSSSTKHATNSGSENEGDENNDDTEDKPECEYGLDCYRKNPQHRKDYKHSTRPRQAKRKAKDKAAKKNTRIKLWYLLINEKILL